MTDKKGGVPVYDDRDGSRDLADSGAGFLNDDQGAGSDVNFLVKESL